MEASSSLSVGGAKGFARAGLNFARTPHRVRFLRSVDQVLAVSEEVMGQLVTFPYQLKPSRIQMMANSIRAGDFAFDDHARSRERLSLGVGDNERVALVAGRLAPDKGVDLAIRAVERVADVRLIVAGDGPDRAKLEFTALQCGVDDRVHFVGRVSRGRLGSLMSGSDALLFPTTRREGSPMILLEAAASGLPVITTESAKVPESLRGEAFSLVVADVDSIVSALRKLTMRDRASYLPLAFEVETLPERLLAASAHMLLPIT